jgi:hypothetical protein
MTATTTIRWHMPGFIDDGEAPPPTTIPSTREALFALPKIRGFIDAATGDAARDGDTNPDVVLCVDRSSPHHKTLILTRLLVGKDTKTYVLGHLGSGDFPELPGWPLLNTEGRGPSVESIPTHLFKHPTEKTMPHMTVEAVARLCHEANRQWCLACGDTSQKTWEEAEQWQRDSAIKGVEFRLQGSPTEDPAFQHVAWMSDKIARGWTHGPVKDATAKTHPCLVAYDDLPEEQRVKDALFVGIVEVVRPYMAVPQTAYADLTGRTLYQLAAQVAEKHGKVASTEHEVGTLQQLLMSAIRRLSVPACREYLTAIKQIAHAVDVPLEEPHGA